jgi:hypothetical protein
MANQLYSNIKEDFLNGTINLLSSDIRILLVKSGYSLDVSTDQYVSDIGSANIAGRSGSLDNVTISGGVLDAENETIENYGTEGFDYLVMYESTGDDTTSRLIAYFDTAAGLPVAGTSGSISITIQWSDLITKIFSL